MEKINPKDFSAMLKKEDIYDFYHSMEKNRVMLSFKGALTTELLDSILQIVEQKLTEFDETTKVKKKVFHILVECLQNLYHHSYFKQNETDESSVILMIAKKKDGYSIVTGNYILKNSVIKLKDRLEEINEMSKEEMKEYYKAVLNNGTFSDKGGGGLGIIDIARKSSERLEYGFIPIDQNNSFFSLNVTINQ